MPTRISFTFYGDTQLDRRLERIELGATSAVTAFERIAESFVRAERRQFRTEGAYGSGGWAPLSEGYAAWKAQHYPGQPILQRTGDLYRSLTGGAGFVRVIEDHFMVVGSSVEYGGFHMRPGPNGRPARKPIELTETLRRSWVKQLQAHIMGEASNAPAVLE